MPNIKIKLFVNESEFALVEDMKEWFEKHQNLKILKTIIRETFDKKWVCFILYVVRKGGGI